MVGNDSEPNYFYVNKGDGTFEDDSYVSGFALNKDGREIASMGIAAGDYENNGLVDFFVTDFGDDYKVLYHNDGDNNFTDVSYKAGVAQPTIPFVGWGDGFLDYDNDGWLDLFEVNGHVYPQVDQHDWGTSLAERSLLFHNVPGKSPQQAIRIGSLRRSSPSSAPASPMSFPLAARLSPTSSTTARSTSSSTPSTARRCCCATSTPTTTTGSR